MKLCGLVLLIATCRASQTVHYDAAAAHPPLKYHHTNQYYQSQDYHHQPLDNHHHQPVDGAQKKFSPIIVEGSQLSTQYLPPHLDYIEPLGPAASKRMDEDSLQNYQQETTQIKSGYAAPIQFVQHKPKSISLNNLKLSNNDIQDHSNQRKDAEITQYGIPKINWMVNQAFNPKNIESNKAAASYVPPQSSYQPNPYYGPVAEANRRSTQQPAQGSGTASSDHVKAATSSGFNGQYIPSSAYYGPVTEAVPILKQITEMDIDGSYSFETLTGDQTHFIQQGHVENLGTEQAENVVQGSYSYIGDDGQTYTVNYVADANGFRATGDHLPTPPPIPDIIQRAIQYNLAEEASRPPNFDPEDNTIYNSKYHPHFANQPTSRNSNYYTARPESYSQPYQPQPTQVQKTQRIPERPSYLTPAPVHEEMQPPKTNGQGSMKDEGPSPRNSHFSPPQQTNEQFPAASSIHAVKAYPSPLSSTVAQTSGFTKHHILKQSHDVSNFVTAETQTVSPRNYHSSSLSAPNPKKNFQPPPSPQQQAQSSNQASSRAWQQLQDSYSSQSQDFKPVLTNIDKLVSKTEESKLSPASAQQRYDSQSETHIYLPQQYNTKYLPKYYIEDNDQAAGNFYQQFDEGYGRRIYPQAQNLRQVAVSTLPSLTFKSNHQIQEEQPPTFNRPTLQTYNPHELNYRQYYQVKNYATPKGFSKRQNDDQSFISSRDNTKDSYSQQVTKVNLPPLGRAGPSMKAYLPPQISNEE